MVAKHVTIGCIVVLIWATAQLSVSRVATAQIIIPPGDRFAIASDFSGLCWDVVGGHFSVGTLVQQFPCNAQRNQHWSFQGLNSNSPFGLIISGSERLCVGVSNVFHLELQDCNYHPPGNPRQLWHVVRYNPLGRRIDQIINQQDNACVDIPDGVLTRVVLNTFSCHRGPNQTWLLLPAPPR